MPSFPHRTEVKILGIYMLEMNNRHASATAQHLATTCSRKLRSEKGPRPAFITQHPVHHTALPRCHCLETGTPSVPASQARHCLSGQTQTPILRSRAPPHVLQHTLEARANPAGGVQGAHLQPSPICGGGMKTQVSAPPEAALISATCDEKLVASAITCTTTDTAR